MSIPKYDDWKLSSGRDDEKTIYECYQCGGDIYEGEDYILTIEGEEVHCDCFDEYARSLLIAFVGIAGEDNE